MLTLTMRALRPTTAFALLAPTPPSPYLLSWLPKTEPPTLVFLSSRPNCVMRTHHDRVGTHQSADLSRRRRVCAIAVRKVLLRQNLVDCFAFDHPELAGLHQLFHEQIGHALTDVLIRAENRGNTALHGGIIEI